MSYFMNKVKYFAYLPIQSKNGGPEKPGQTNIFKLGLRYNFFMNNPDFETQQQTTIMV